MLLRVLTCHTGTAWGQQGDDRKQRDAKVRDTFQVLSGLRWSPALRCVMSLDGQIVAGDGFYSVVTHKHFYDF